MKVFISGDTKDHKMIHIVQGLGHEAVIPPNSQDGRGVEGVLRQSIQNTMFVVFFEPSYIPRGLGDHISATNMSGITYFLGGKKEGVSKSIEMMSPVKAVDSFAEIEKDLERRIREVKLRKESEANSSKERR